MVILFCLCPGLVLITKVPCTSVSRDLLNGDRRSVVSIVVSPDPFPSVSGGATSISLAGSLLVRLLPDGDEPDHGRCGTTFTSGTRDQPNHD